MNGQNNRPIIDVLMEDILYEYSPEWTVKVGNNPFRIGFYNKDVLEIIVLGESAHICASRLGIKEQ